LATTIFPLLVHAANNEPQENSPTQQFQQPQANQLATLGHMFDLGKALLSLSNIHFHFFSEIEEKAGWKAQETGVDIKKPWKQLYAFKTEFEKTVVGYLSLPSYNSFLQNPDRLPLQLIWLEEGVQRTVDAINTFLSDRENDGSAYKHTLGLARDRLKACLGVFTQQMATTTKQ
jgi:hypothetical protein